MKTYQQEVLYKSSRKAIKAASKSRRNRGSRGSYISAINVQVEVKK